MNERYNPEKFEVSFERYEIIEGDISNALLQLLSAEYYKSTNKKIEGAAFAEKLFDDLRREVLNKGEDPSQIKLENSPTFLATVMKNPNIKGIIDPDSSGNIKHKKGFNAEKVEKLNQAIKLYQKKIVEILQKEMKEEKPFLHTVVSEGRKEYTTEDGKPIIIISGGMRNGRLPADPRVLRWFTEQLQNKLDAENIESKVKINQEGKPLCGAVVHTGRRETLGNLYQFIKVKVPTRLLKDSIIIDKIAQILVEFSERHPDQESFNDFLKANTTLEDVIRLEGKMYFENGLQESEEIAESEVAMSGNLRRALFLQVGDRVKVFEAGSQDSDNRKGVFLKVIPAKIKDKNGDNRPEEDRVGYRLPAVSQEALKNFGGNKKIVIEKVESK